MSLDAPSPGLWRTCSTGACSAGLGSPWQLQLCNVELQRTARSSCTTAAAAAPPLGRGSLLAPERCVPVVFDSVLRPPWERLCDVAPPEGTGVVKIKVGQRRHM